MNERNLIPNYDSQCACWIRLPECFFAAERRRIFPIPLPPLWPNSFHGLSTVASCARNQEEGPAPRFRVSSRVPLARLLFTMSLQWRACSHAKLFPIYPSIRSSSSCGLSQSQYTRRVFVPSSLNPSSCIIL